MKMLDVVALTEDLPEKGLRRRQVGTIVDVLAPGVFEVEFANNAGRTYASLTVVESRLMLLHYKPAEQAA